MLQSAGLLKLMLNFVLMVKIHGRELCLGEFTIATSTTKKEMLTLACNLMLERTIFNSSIAV